MFKTLRSAYNLFDTDSRNFFYFILFLGMCASILEVFGLSLIIPIVTIILNDNIYGLNPKLDIFLNFLGSPKQDIILPLALGFLLFFYISKSLFSTYLLFKQNDLIGRLKVKISKFIFENYLFKEYSFFSDMKSSIILRNIRRETDLFMEVIVQAMIICITEIFVILGILVLLFYFQPLGSFFIFVLILFIIFVHRILTKKMTYKFGKKRQENEALCIETIQQSISSIITVKLKKLEEEILDKFNFFASEEAHAQKIQATLQELPRMWLELLAISSLSIFILVMYYQNYETSQIIAILAIFGGATFRILPSMNRTFVAIQKLRYGNPIIEVMNQLFAEYKKIDKSNLVDDEILVNKAKTIKDNLIELNNVSFKYNLNGEQILDNLNLLIKEKEKVVIIGDTGAGKSTLLNIILGLLKPSRGKVLFKTADINRIINFYRNKISYVPQSVFLFNDTILKNIASFKKDKNIDLEKVNNILKVVDLFDFVENLPDKLSTIISENSNNISGGQKQKIGLARALYLESEILILDEPTSAIDESSKEKIMKNILSFSKNHIVIMITHDLNSLKYFDTKYLIQNKKLLKKT